MSLEARSGVAARTFRTAEVARIIGVSSRRVRAWVREGLCRPQRSGRAYAFSFQDLVLLRAAHGLIRARVPSARVRRGLRELSRQLPRDRPISGVRIYADGKHVTVRDGRRAWIPESGQTVFVFDVGELARHSLKVISAKPPARAGAECSREEEAFRFFDEALDTEEDDRERACELYRRAVQLDPTLTDAWINLGRLVHERGNVREAIELYRQALEHEPRDSIAHYDLAMALEDIGDEEGAERHYRRAVALDGSFADAHFNLARLLERLGQRVQALRHFMAYKKLTK